MQDVAPECVVQTNEICQKRTNKTTSDGSGLFEHAILHECKWDDCQIARISFRKLAGSTGRSACPMLNGWLPKVRPGKGKKG